MFESFLGVNPWTALFILLNTLTIFFVPKKFLFKPVMKIISDRQKEIDDLYADAGAAKEQARQLQESYQQKLNAAQETSDRIVKEAVARGQSREEQIIRDANAQAAAIMDKAARDIIEKAGYGEYFTHRTGHSIGLEVHETGDVSAVNAAIIQPGQCFSVEPGIYIPEENIGVRIEDLVLITEDGCEVLNHYPKELQVIPFPESR